MAGFPDPKDFKSWEEIWQEYTRQSDLWTGWLFRGQKHEEDDCRPSLKTSLERALERFGVSITEARKYECWLLRDFVRRCHLVATYPQADNKMEWLALLRHYGGPTRLSDWTYSFWVALFFALNRAQKGDLCEIWALNPDLWKKQTKKRQGRLKKAFEKHGSNSRQEGDALFNIKNRSGIWFMNAFRLNDRLAAQQGAFVVPLDITKSLDANMLSGVSGKNIREHLRIYRIRVTKDLLKKCLWELQRMNITRSTLYLGIEGLAQHQENLIGMPDLFKGVECDLSRITFD